GGEAVRGVLPAQNAVGDRGTPLRDRDGEVVRRLVLGVVVAREPGHRALRLTRDERPVVGGYPAVGGAVRVGDRLGGALVGDRDAEPLVLAQGTARGDDEFVAAAAEAGGGAVDGDAGDLQAREVEVEAVEPLGGAGGEDRLAVQVPGGGVVAERQVVVADVVAAVAAEREVGVAGAGRARGAGRRRSGGPDEGRDGDGDGGEDRPAAEDCGAAAC